MDRCPYELDPNGTDLPGEAAALNSRGPATRVLFPGAVEGWMVTDPELLRALFTDPRVSKDARRNWPALATMSPEWPLHTWVTVRNMFTADGEEHRRLRALVGPAFTARRILGMRPRIEQIAVRLLDEMSATEPGAEVDLRERFAYPLPLEVITSLLGITDPQTRADLRRASAAIFSTSLSAAEQVTEMELYYSTLARVVADKRRAPGDDLPSALLESRDEDGSRLSEDELADTLGLVIVAGHETTVNLLDHALTLLLNRPRLRERVEGGEVSWGGFIEETLRWQPPVANLPMRFTTADVELPGGDTIRPGEPIMAGLLAANRHPDHHADAAGSDTGQPDAGQPDAADSNPGRSATARSDPAEFDPDRRRAGHLTFGHGAHFCLGASLARLEAEIALPAIFARFPDIIATADPVPAGDSFIANAHRALPAVLRPTG